MSYDIWLEMDTGGDEPAQVCEVGNHTWNCGLMFSTALGIESLNDLDGQNAGEWAEKCCQGVNDMLSRPAVYETMNPPNGWGSYETALKYLQTLAIACRKHPKATIRVC